MKNIFDVLKDSHEKQRLLLDTLMETSGDTPARQEFYHNLKQELEQHSAAEERFFYAPLIDSDKTIELSRHGIAEHHEFDKLLEQLDATDMSSPSWLNLMKTLRHEVLHHLEDEEQTFFQLAGKVLTDNQKATLADGYLEEMDETH